LKFVRHFLEDSFFGDPADVPPWWGSVADSSIATVSPRYVGDREMGHGAVLGAAGERRAIYFTQLEAAQARDSIVRTNFTPSWTGGSTGWAVFVGARVSGTTAAWNGYFVDCRLLAGQLALVKGTAGVGADLATAAVNFATLGAHFNILFEVTGPAGGTTIRAKVWADGTAEPVGWTVTFNDVAAIVTVGGNVIGTLKGAGVSAAGTRIAYVAAATGGDAVPAPPILWADYLELLRTQDVLLCLLAEIDVLGSASDGVTALPARLCMSSMGYVSSPADPLPNICYEEILLRGPTIRRRMSSAFTGRSTMTYGDVIVKNEVSNDDFTARLDRWLSWNMDGRPIRLLLGHPTWRRVDFRTVLLGKVQDLAPNDVGSFAIKLRGIEAIMQKPLTTTLIGGTGPNAFSLEPYSLGTFFNAPAKLYDPNGSLGPIYTIERVNGYGLQPATMDVREGGVSRNFPATISAVNAGTDTITTGAPHNLIVGAMVIYDPLTTPPAPLTPNATYYVKTAPTGSSYTLAPDANLLNTIDITGNTTGATQIGRNYQLDPVNHRVMLLGNPSADITVDVLGVSINVSNGIAQVLTSSTIPLSEAFTLDPVHNTIVGKLVGGVWNEQMEVGEAADQIVRSAGASWCFAREGTYYLTVLDIPGTVAAWNVVADDILSWRIGERMLPANVERLGYLKNHSIQSGGGLLGAVTPTARDLYGRDNTLVGYTPTELTLDQPANHILVQDLPERETLLMDGAETQAEVARLYAMRRTASGTWIFTTDAWALAVEIGDNVNIVYPRDGFALGKNAIVVGTADDLDQFRTELEVWAPIAASFPVVTAGQPFVSEANY
jgi:hypothetical protein